MIFWKYLPVCDKNNMHLSEISQEFEIDLWKSFSQRITGILRIAGCQEMKILFS